MATFTFERCSRCGAADVPVVHCILGAPGDEDEDEDDDSGCTEAQRAHPCRACIGDNGLVVLARGGNFQAGHLTCLAEFTGEDADALALRQVLSQQQVSQMLELMAEHREQLQQATGQRMLDLLEAIHRGQLQPELVGSAGCGARSCAPRAGPHCGAALQLQCVAVDETKTAIGQPPAVASVRF